jgi:hypothetical protein
MDESAQESLNGAFIGFAETNLKEVELMASRERCLVSGDALQSREGEQVAGEDFRGFRGGSSSVGREGA